MDDLLSQTMHRIADDAPAGPDLGARLAARALHGAARRRTAGIAAAGAAAAAVALIATTAALHGSSSTVSPEAAKSPKTQKTSAPAVGMLPANTPAQLAIVRACMVGDPSIPDPRWRPSFGPNGHAQPPRDLTGPGTHVADFRYLAAANRNARGQVVLLGSTVAFRTCLLDPSGTPTKSDRIPHQTATPWNDAVPFDTFPNDVILDEESGGQLGEKDSTFAQAKRAGWIASIGGRTAPGVAKITFTANGKTLQTTVTNQFFVAQHFGTGLFPDPVHPATGVVKLYSADGQHVLKTLQMELDPTLFA